ncbi:MAG: biotin--[acetyl-CoA-carboxylase] ligase [Candidatus Omnitrophota bacterium]
MKERIINFLKSSNNYISGQDLSDNLKISRAAIWKHINELREAGYEIEAVPHLGYKLTYIPDRLFPHEISYNLKTKIIGKKIYHLETTSSTMDVAQKLAIDNSPSGTIVVAETQTRGRGRLMRSWSSPKYKGIYVSMILRPKISPQCAPQLTLLTAFSIYQAIKNITGLEAKIKWPNDLMLEHSAKGETSPLRGGKKICGILTQMQAEQDEFYFVIIGIGLNVNSKKDELPDNAASLKEFFKEEISRIELLKEMLRCFEANYLKFCKNGFLDILEKVKAISYTLGRNIKLKLHNKIVEGEAVDIDKDTALIIHKLHGGIEKIFTGDILTIC